MRLRGQRQDQDRRVGRIDLAVGRVAAAGGRQVGARGVDRRLHVARGAVDVAVEVELQRDARRADASSCEVISVTSAIWPRCRSSGVGDARRHRLRAGARQGGA